MESFEPLVPLGCLHKHKFQRLIRDRWSQARHPWDLHIPLGEWFQESTSQWGKIGWLSQGVPIPLSPPPPPSPGTPVHRRLSGGLGSTCGPPHSLRPLAGEHDVLSHQPSGTGGCLPGSQNWRLSSRLSELEAVFQALRTGGCLPGSQNWRLSSRLSELEAVFQALRTGGCLPGSQNWRLSSRLSELEAVFQALRTGGCLPGSQNWRLSSRLSELEAVFQALRTGGCLPGSQNWRLSSRLSELEAVFQALRTGGCLPGTQNWRLSSRHSELEAVFQALRTGGCLPGTHTVSPLSGRQEIPPPHRQHDRGMLHQQAGGIPFLVSLAENREASSVVLWPVHPVVAVCSGQIKHSGRRPQSTTYDPAVGMGSSQFGQPGSLLTSTSLPLASAIACHCMCPQFQTQQPGQWTHCLPPYSHHRKSSQKGTRRKGHPHSSGPSLASPGLVSRASPSLSCSAHQPSAGPTVSSSAQVRGSARKPRGAAPSRLASVRDSLSSLGASPSVLRLVDCAHRPGTQGVYSAHWDGWVRWCADRSVPPHSPSSCDLENFLAFLSCDKGLSASLVKMHLSAVCTTIRQMGGSTFSDDPLLRDLVRGAALAEAKSPHRIPSWDLFLVLSALRLPPYEPLKQSSLKHLTLKTTFLVSFSSGRRCSQVHALSGLPNDVAFEPDGSMSLRFLPHFLAKNQLPGSPSPVIFVRSLSSILAGMMRRVALPYESFASLQEANGVFSLQAA